MKKQQETPHNAEYFMGIDLSTQQLKGIIVDKASNFGVVSEHFVHFDTELQHYRTVGGAHLGEDGVTVTAPVLMWVEALDVLFEKFQQSGFRLENILCISGTAQRKMQTSNMAVFIGKSKASTSCRRQIMNENLHKSFKTRIVLWSKTVPSGWTQAQKWNASNWLSNLATNTFHTILAQNCSIVSLRLKF
eukprot:Sdes_comp15546_c0_seq2m4509